MKVVFEYLARAKKLLRYFPLVSKMVNFSAQRVEYFGASYKLFAYFAFGVLVVPHLLWPGSESIMIYSYEVAILLTLVGTLLIFTLLTSDSWGEKWQRYLPLYWHFTVMYCLVFLPTFLYLYHKGETPWLVNVALALLLLAILVDWISFVILTLIGIFLGGVLYNYLVVAKGAYNTFNQIDKIILFVYVASFASLVGVFFSRTRELSQVVETNKKLKEALAVKTEILDNISHETRTPIQGVLGMSSALVDSWQHMSEERRYSAISTIYDSSKRLMSFVDNLVDLSKYKQGKAKFELKQVHFRSILEEVLKEVELFYMPNRNIDLKVAIADGVKDVILGDEYKLTQLLRNIIGNAFKYMDEGELSISLSNQDDQLLLCVDDEGVGIPEAELEEIFDPFIQSSYTKTGAGGTGVGLTVARDIVIGHSGKIWAESRSPKGARFCITLPLLGSHNKVGSNYEEEKTPSLRENSSSNLRAMIIDDEDIALNTLDMIITSCCAEVILYNSAVEALGYLQKNPESVDIILLDVMMPRMTGLEFLELIRQDPKLKYIKVLIQSGNFDQKVMQKAVELGVIGYITKPYSKEKVLEAMMKAENRR